MTATLGVFLLVGAAWAGALVPDRSALAARLATVGRMS